MDLNREKVCHMYLSDCLYLHKLKNNFIFIVISLCSCAWSWCNCCWWVSTYSDSDSSKHCDKRSYTTASLQVSQHSAADSADAARSVGGPSSCSRHGMFICPRPDVLERQYPQLQSERKWIYIIQMNFLMFHFCYFGNLCNYFTFYNASLNLTTA